MLPAKFENAARPISVPVNDYFSANSYSSYVDLKQTQVDGLVKEIISTTTAYENVIAIEQAYNKDISPTEYKYLELKSYLAIGYTDIFGQRHVEYYFVFPNFSYKILPEKGEEIITRHYELYSSSVSAHDSLDKVIQAAKGEKNPNLVESVISYFNQHINYYKMDQYYYRTTGCHIENLLECDPSAPG